MNRIALIIILTVAGMAAAQVTATFYGQGVSISDMCLHRLPDGGVSAESWGKADGGPMSHLTYGKLDLTSTRAAQALSLMDDAGRGILLNITGYGDGGTL